MEGFHYLCHKPNRMHSNKELIIHLILQHMRHVQLISLLEKAGFDFEDKLLDISTVVAGMMGIPKDEITDQWLDRYVDFLDMASAYAWDAKGDQLRPLAEICYIQVQRALTGSHV